MEFRVRSSGELKSQGEIRKLNPNVSLPKVWNENVYEALGIDPVNVTLQPSPSAAYKRVVRDGAEQDSGGFWRQKWIEQDMFSDTEEATKSEQETAYQAKLDADKAESVRFERDQKLKDTDWMGMSDVTMSADWATYRQALRDVPAQSGFPNSITWPDEP